MRLSAQWMEQLDERILERLVEGDSSSWEISVDVVTNVSPDRVRERLQVLANAELVDSYDREIIPGRVETVWSITTWGSRFLQGDVDPELERPIPSSRPPYATRPGWWAGFR